MRLEAETDSDDDDDDDDEDGDDKRTLVVSLTQKYARKKKTQRKVDTETAVGIGFSIYEVWWSRLSPSLISIVTRCTKAPNFA